jgi:hypothetical protein
MMEAYGRAMIEDRLKPRQFAELAAYVHGEYGPRAGPGFLIAEAANGSARGRRRRREAAEGGLIRTLVKAAKSLVVGSGNGRKANASNPAR